MRRAIVLKHAEFEGPARVGEILEEMGFTLDVRSTFRGDPVPASLADGDVLVVMGGPMSVSDREQPETAYLQKEIDLIRRRLINEYHYCEECATDILNYATSIFSSGTAKESV